MRFRQFLSDSSEEIRKQWECENCQENLRFVNRNCPLEISASDVTEDKILEEEIPNAAVVKSKYGFQQIIKKREEKLVELQSQPEGRSNLPILKHGDFDFYECPVPIITESLMSSIDRFANFIINIVNWSEATGAMPVQGGLLDQANLFYECRLIVLNEQNKIEKEKHDDLKKDMDHKNKSRANKPASTGALGRKNG